LLYLTIGLIVGGAATWLAGRPVIARMRSQIENDRALHAERLKTYADAEARFRDAFASLSAQALNKNNETFLHLAETRLKQARTEATADIDARKKAIDDLLAPMAKTLERVDHEILDAERRRVQDGASLLQRVASLDAIGKDLQAETRRLVDALKRPGVRGRWGELQLKRVVELAGMIEHCDFEEQQTLAANDRRVRPDVVVRLPGGKHVIVDAKVPLDAYLRRLFQRVFRSSC
jgi:DNA recombination protein RmuC